MKPQAQYGIEGRKLWFSDLPSLPQTVTGQGDKGAGDTPARFEAIRLSNRQHPDPTPPIGSQFDHDFLRLT